MAKRNPCSTSETGIRMVFGAGGVIGVAHIGVIRALERHNVSFKHLTGASVGALTATFVANGYTADKMEKIFLSEEFRYPPWDVWARCLHLDNPWGLIPGTIDFGPWLAYIVDKYKLKPKANLRLVAADAFTHRPIIFEGVDYDLIFGLKASCAAPMMGLQTVWYPYTSAHDHPSQAFPLSPYPLLAWRQMLERNMRERIMAWQSQFNPHTYKDLGEGCSPLMGGHLMVDGFYYHPIPANLYDCPAIVSKLGFARKMPSERLSPAAMFLHFREMMLAPYFDLKYPDPSGHVIIEAGTGDVSAMSFDISLGKMRELIAYAEQATTERLSKTDALKILQDNK